MSIEQTTFEKIPYGEKFAWNNVELIKMKAELCNFDNLCDSQRVRTKIKNETTGYEAVGRAAVVFNSVSIKDGLLYSIGDDYDVKWLKGNFIFVPDAEQNSGV